MKDLPVLKYNDLREVMWLDHHNDLNSTVIDDASLEVMLRIEKIMSRLDVVGDDDRRQLWIELKAPRKCDREEDADENGNYWYLLITGCYQQMHYLILSNKGWRFIDLRSHEHGHGERKPDVWHGNVSKALKKLESYVAALVDRICANPDEYNDYVAENHAAITITGTTVNSKRMKKQSVSSSRTSPLCLLTTTMASASSVRRTKCSVPQSC